MLKFSLFIGCALILAVAALPIVGCGDDNSSASSDRAAGPGDEITVETRSLAKAQFIKRADAICRARSEQVETQFSAYLRENSDLGSSQSAKSTAAKELIETIYLPAGQKQLDRIVSLGAPSGDEDEVAAILEAMQKGNQEAENHPLKFVRALSRTYLPFAEAEKLAQAYGLTECGRG